MRKTTAKELESVLRLEGPARYDHFVKRVADEEMAWGLWKDGGWALMADDDGVNVFPLWPAKEYAVACATGDWAGYEAERIELHGLLQELLPKLAASNTRAGVFPIPSGRGVATSAQGLVETLSRELEKYA